MTKFWTHAGANYAVNVDQVAHVWAEDLEKSVGGTTTIQTCLTFLMVNGHAMRNLYEHREHRDDALRRFYEFANATPATGGPPTHEVSWARREIGGQTILVLTGCACGWRAPDGVDPEDAVVSHLAAVRAQAK